MKGPGLPSPPPSAPPANAFGLAAAVKRHSKSGNKLAAAELLDELRTLARRRTDDELAALRGREEKAALRNEQARRKERSRDA